MKITKNELKEIVKECLVEIFSESFSQHTSDSFHHKASHVPKAIKESSTKLVRPQIKTGDPVLDDILRDTASTTLPSMMEAETRKGSLPATALDRLVENSTPEQMFGGAAAEKWAALAFADPVKKS